MKQKIISILLAIILPMSFVPAATSIVFAETVIPGDINGDGAVTSDDAIYLLYHTLLPDMYPVNQAVDFNGDGDVTSDDAIYLLYYTLLPDMYPLNTGGEEPGGDEPGDEGGDPDGDGWTPFVPI